MCQGEKNGARVFVIGAGASYGAGLPDASHALVSLFAYIGGTFTPAVRNRTPVDLFSPLLQAFIEVIKHHNPRGGSVERFPLEVLVADFNAAARRNPSRFMRLLELLYQATREWLYNLSCMNAHKFHDFVSRLRPGDIILTFNWDMCLEIAMATCKVRFTRSPEPSNHSNAIRLLKIHGSIDDLIVKRGTANETLVERCGLELPALPNPDCQIERYELVRLRTYDLPFHGIVTWNLETRHVTLEIIEEPVPNIETYPDLFPFQLERRLLPECSPHLLMPGGPAPLYDCSYATVYKVAASIHRPVESIFVVGYSFPGYDMSALAVLKKIADHFGQPLTYIVNPAAYEIPRKVLTGIFGRFELCASKFAEFDWTKA